MSEMGTDATGQDPFAHDPFAHNPVPHNPAEQSPAVPEDRQWSAARELAVRAPLTPAEKTSDSRAILLLAALVLIACAVGLGFAFVVPRDEINGTEPAARQRELLQMVAFALGIAGACTLFGGFIWASLTGRFASRWNSVLSPLTTAERRWARAALAGNTDATPQRRPALLAYAGEVRRSSLGIAPLYLAVGMVAVSAALVGSEPAVVALQYTVGVVALAGLVHLALTYRRARAFIARHTATGR